MIQAEFNREENSLPLAYDSNTHQPIRRYRLTKSQIKFLVTICRHLAGKNSLAANAELNHKFIQNVINVGQYQEEQIPYLKYIRDKYKFLYKKRSPYSDIKIDYAS